MGAAEAGRWGPLRPVDHLRKLLPSTGIGTGFTIGRVGAADGSGPLPREGRLTSVFQTITFFWTGRGPAADP